MTQHPTDSATSSRPSDRPSNREVEDENLSPSKDGKAPRPATEPHGGESSTESSETRTDPGSGEN
jgi:hypothetical protein